MRTQTFANELRSRTTARRFAGGSGVTLTGMAQTLPAGADELPRVSENGAIAKALNYVHDARTVDAAMRFSDRYCRNCAFFIGGAHDRWARCDTFPGKAVAVRGWCNAWASERSTVK